MSYQTAFAVILLTRFAHSFNLRFSNLQNIVFSKAVVSSVTQNINSNIFTENPVLNDISNTKIHVDLDISYVLLFISYTYFQNNFAFHSKNEKLNNIEMFSNTRKKMNSFLLIFSIIFTKNVENAI